VNLIYPMQESESGVKNNILVSVGTWGPPKTTLSTTTQSIIQCYGTILSKKSADEYEAMIKMAESGSDYIYTGTIASINQAGLALEECRVLGKVGNIK
jgi:hypothetical protein